jgi:hypothetical protein
LSLGTVIASNVVCVSEALATTATGNQLSSSGAAPCRTEEE